MKNIILLIFGLAVVMMSCDKKGNIIDEKPIGLSTRGVSLFADETTATVYTDRTDWRFEGFAEHGTMEMLMETPSSQTGLDDAVYSYDWISVRKSGLDKIIIELQPNGPPYNPNDMEPCGGRVISICVSAGENKEYISVSQVDVPDFERFSSKQPYFSSTGGRETVTADKESWYFYGFMDPYNNKLLKFIDRPNGGLVDGTVHTYDWISVSRPEVREITIEVEPNPTGKLRSVKINIFCFEFYQSITVTQGK